MNNRVEDVMASFGGRQFLDCYNDLCIAIEVEIMYLPERPQMKVICAEVCSRVKKGGHAVSRSLSRAVEDLWFHGESEIIALYCRGWNRYKPTPHEFIYEVARKIRSEESLYV